jgi:hypothetical protein
MGRVGRERIRPWYQGPCHSSLLRDKRFEMMHGDEFAGSTTLSSLSSLPAATLSICGVLAPIHGPDCLCLKKEMISVGLLLMPGCLNPWAHPVQQMGSLSFDR